MHWAMYIAPHPMQRALLRLLRDRGAAPFVRGFDGRTLMHSIVLSEDCDAALIPEVAALCAAASQSHIACTKP